MNTNLLNIGLYSIPEASKISRVKQQTIRRWINGYNIKKDNIISKKEALWQPDVPKISGVVALSFKDLIEIRFVNEFRNLGVSWKVIKTAVEYAAKELNEKHPLCSKKFVTDKKRIFDQFEENLDKKLLDTLSGQFQITEVIKPSLHKGLEFNQQGIVERWYPNHNKEDVVIDPKISFGKPIVTECGISTEILFRSYKAEGDFKRVASIFDIKTSHVKSAVHFEERLAA
jgi:DNA-binding transcriptional MerR regulator/uncharacterized protein (DUF433 family)